MDTDPSPSGSPEGLTTNSSELLYAGDLRSGSGESEIQPLVEKSVKEKGLVRKLDQRILPIICLLYLFACEPHLPYFSGLDQDYILADLDRTNLGNARLQGLPQDTLGGDPTGNLFDWVNSAFFFPYVKFQ